MTAEVIPFPQDAVTLKDGHAITTSLYVAEVFGKPHKDVLHKVKTLDCSDEFARRNFSPGSYLDANNQSRPMFEISRDGFTFLAMGFTGSKAARFKEAYICAFNKMEAMLHQAAPVIDREALAEMVRQVVAEALPQPVSTAPRRQVLVDAADYELLRLKAEKSTNRRPFNEEEKTTMRVLRAQGWSYGQIAGKVGRTDNSVSDFFRRERMRKKERAEDQGHCHPHPFCDIHKTSSNKASSLTGRGLSFLNRFTLTIPSPFSILHP